MWALQAQVSLLFTLIKRFTLVNMNDKLILKNNKITWIKKKLHEKPCEQYRLKWASCLL